MGDWTDGLSIYFKTSRYDNVSNILKRQKSWSRKGFYVKYEDTIIDSNLEIKMYISSLNLENID